MKRDTVVQRIVLALVVIFTTASHAPAQGGGASLSGRVTDPQGAAVPGASVRLYARERREVRVSTTTDQSGAYRFERLAPGAYLLEAEAAGFARGAAREVTVGRGAAPSADITLEVEGVSAEVVITASDAPQTVDEVSKAATVVSRREIEERDEPTLAEALRTVPGLRVQQLGGPGSFTSIKTRGLRNQDTALLIDGLRFRDPAAERGDATSFLSDFVVTGAGRVEILRGSGSSLYGSNAVGGVVNVVTDEGGGPFRGELFAEGGGLGFGRGRAQVSGSAGEAERLAYSAAFSHLNVARGVDGDDAARNTTAQGRALFRLTPTATLSARVYASDSFAQLNEEPQAVGALPATGVVEARPVPRGELRRYESGAALSNLNLGGATFLPGANDADYSRAGRFFSGALTFTQRLSEDFGYAVTYHGLVTRNAYREGPATPGRPADNFFEPAGPTRNSYDASVHTLNARADFSPGRHHRVTAGYEFEDESYLNSFLDATPAGNSSVEIGERSHAFFAHDQMHYLDGRLQLAASFRAQTFALGRPVFTPSAGAPYGGLTLNSPPTAYTGDGSVAYLFRSTGTKLRGHVGNGYRKPSLYERFGTFFSTFSGFGALGDPRLAPDRSVAFDAGLDQQLANDRVRLSATYFYTRLQEVVGFGDVGTADPFGRFFSGYVNTGGGLARGAELSATLAPTRTTDVFASYTYTNSDQRRPQVEDILRSLAVADHQFSFVVTQRLGRRAAVNFDFVATGDYLAPVFDNRTFRSRAFRFSGQRRADLTAGYTFPLAESRSLRLFGKVENVFNQDYYESGFRTPRANARAGATFNF
ncbi:MAG TPA: TonB-dependent receptor [Pyrinomonadaceae bacterium]|jgi:iron complex outermembrane receptor protein|nr:TonB-dependent receptor [Pyrinomonadaceae bacterium]